jgi:hypothetical protein
MANGVLEVELPKAESAKPLRIPVGGTLPPAARRRTPTSPHGGVHPLLPPHHERCVCRVIEAARLAATISASMNRSTFAMSGSLRTSILTSLEGGRYVFSG